MLRRLRGRCISTSLLAAISLEEKAEFKNNTHGSDLVQEQKNLSPLLDNLLLAPDVQKALFTSGIEPFDSFLPWQRVECIKSLTIVLEKGLPRVPFQMKTLLQ